MLGGSPWVGRAKGDRARSIRLFYVRRPAPNLTKVEAAPKIQRLRTACVGSLCGRLRKGRLPLGKSVRLRFVPVVRRVIVTVLMLVVVIVIMVVVFGVRVGVVMPMIVFVVMRMIVHLHGRARRVDVPGVIVIVPGSKKHQREDDARRDGEYRARLRAAPVRPFEKFGQKPVERDEEEGRGRHHEGVGKKLLRPMEGR